MRWSPTDEDFTTIIEILMHYKETTEAFGFKRKVFCGFGFVVLVGPVIWNGFFRIFKRYQLSKKSNPVFRILLLVLNCEKVGLEVGELSALSASLTVLLD